MSFLILRNYEMLPDQITGDVDILVAPEDLARAEADLISQGQNYGLELINRTWFSPLALFFAHPETGTQLHIDLFKHLVWRGIPLIDTQEVLSRRQVHANGFFIPHPIDEAVISLLTRLMYRGQVKEVYRTSIQSAFAGDEHEAGRILHTLFGRQEIVQWVREAQWDKLTAQAGALRIAACWRQLGHPVRWLSALWRDADRLTRRLFCPPGILIITLGPDGAGKSTLAGHLQTRLAMTFAEEKGLYIHWKPRTRQTHVGTTVVDPHGKKARSFFLSHLFLIFHWGGFVIGGVRVVWPTLFRNGMVLVDRYFHDLRVDPRRYRLDVRTAGIRFLTRLLPRPDLIFVLEAPAKLLQSRKSEVSPEETARQSTAYRKLAAEYPQARILDASRPRDEVAIQAERMVFEYLKDRQRDRQPGLS